jgi:SulP family sulfate permease
MDNSKLWGDEKLMYDEFKDRIYIKHLYGPLFWIYITFSKIVSELDPNIKALVIRMDRVPFVDQSGLYALEEAFFHSGKRGVHILIIGLQSQPLDKLTSINIIPNLMNHKFLMT